MKIQWRSQTRPNGKRDQRDVVFGLDKYLPDMAIVAAIATATWLISTQLGDLRRDAAVDRVETGARFEKIESAIAAKQAQRDLERDQMNDKLNRILGGQVALQGHAEDLQDQTRHLLGIAEKLPIPKEKRR